MSLEQIKMDLEEDIARNKYRVEAWKNITYLTEKNGSPYKIMAKNFENAKYGKLYRSLDSVYLEVSIEFNRNDNRYKVYDEIFCGDKFKEDTLEEIKEKVVERIEYLKNKIESQKHQLTIIESIYKEFEQSYNDICKRLKDLCGTNEYGHITGIGSAIYRDIVDPFIF